MAILKSQDARRASKGAIVLDLGDLKRQAEVLKENAQAECQRILKIAEEQRDALSEKAHGDGFEVGKKDGYDAGFAQGLEDAKAQVFAEMNEQMKGIEDSWMEAGKVWEAYRNGIDVQMREAVLEMTLAISKRVVHRVIEVDNTVIIDQLGHTLSHILRPLDVLVKINPSDREIIEGVMPNLATEFKYLKTITLEDDILVDRGGCEVHFGYGVIDSGVNHQLEKLVDAFLPKGESETMKALGDGVGFGEVDEAGLDVLTKAAEDKAAEKISEIMEEAAKVDEEGVVKPFDELSQMLDDDDTDAQDGAGGEVL